jgi:hypothetical protein
VGPVRAFERSHPAADASREVVERWLLDGLMVTGGVPVTQLRKMILEELQASSLRSTYHTFLHPHS